MMKIDNKNYLTTEEVADKLDMRNYTIRRLIRLGRLPASKLGSVYYVDESDLIKLLKSNKGE